MKRIRLHPTKRDFETALKERARNEDLFTCCLLSQAIKRHIPEVGIPETFPENVYLRQGGWHLHKGGWHLHTGGELVHWFDSIAKEPAIAQEILSDAERRKQLWNERPRKTFTLKIVEPYTGGTD